jgi:hypothetical protein
VIFGWTLVGLKQTADWKSSACAEASHSAAIADSVNETVKQPGRLHWIILLESKTV